MGMKGYVKNISPMWVHAMKRSIGPGAKVPIEELYEQYGVKYDIKEGEDFVQWLRNVKLKDSKRWRIVLQQEEDEAKDVKAEQETKSKAKDGGLDNVAPLVPKKMEVSHIVELSVRKGREVLPKIMDLSLLKYALQEANQLSGKDSLCRIIRKRIKELQVGR